jgi:hypothetical protein
MVNTQQRWQLHPAGQCSVIYSLCEKAFLKLVIVLNYNTQLKKIVYDIIVSRYFVVKG